MEQSVVIQKLGQKLWLSSGRCVYWEDQQVLLLSDLHIGKVAHFRKSGIAIPGQVFEEDLQRLTRLLNHFKPRTILVAGDFFHSQANEEHLLFGQWRAALKDVRVLLVRGNHEVLPDYAYSVLGIEVVGRQFHMPPFSFVHEKTACLSDDTFWFSGHLHPGIQLGGKGRQSLVLPCFHFAGNHCVLPAFSRFTGRYLIEAGKGDQVYAIADREGENLVIPVHS